MSGNGKPQGRGEAGISVAAGQALRWSAPVLNAEDLRRNLNGRREVILLPKTIVTPLAAEHLRDHDIRVIRHIEPAPQSKAASDTWGFAQEHPQPLVTSALQALEREGVRFQALPPATGTQPGAWSRSVAECIAAGTCRGGRVFCADAGLVCCVANKLAGLRAIAVASLPQAARAKAALGPNLVAIEMPGRTFFELRQIIRTLCQAAHPVCPAGVANTLRELDGHAHR